MKPSKVAVFFLFLLLSILLCGCTSGPPEDETYDSRLIGQWRNERTSEILEFFANGIYTITEKEMANWSTASGGKLWMDGTLYSYSLSENDTVLSTTESGYTRTYRRI